MSSSTTPRLGFVKPNPGTGEPVNVATQINATLDKIDAAISAASVTSGTRPASPFDGQIIRETDSRLMYVRNNTQSAWDGILTSPGGTLFVNSSNQLVWSNDTILYRSAANTLKTDDHLQVAHTSGILVNGGAHKMLTQVMDFQLGAAYPLTATVTDLPSMTWTFSTLRANALAVVKWVGDFTTTAGSAGTGLMRINVDGVDVATPEAHFNGGNTTAGTRSTTSNDTHVILSSAGSHTIKARASMAGTLGMKLEALHTTMNILIFE